MNKIKFFTHNDLDGVGCGILGILAYDNIDVEYVNYNDINEKIKVFLENNDIGLNCEYTYMYITDITPNEDIANLINEKNKDSLMADGLPIVSLFDHHKTADWLNKYDWAKVVNLNEKFKFLESGTSLFYEHLTNKVLKSTPKLDQFVNLIRQYDTWEWTKYNVQQAKDLNDIYHLIGIDDFIQEYTNILKQIVSYDKFKIVENHMNLLKYKRKEIDTYISKKLEIVKIFDDEFGNKVGFIVADSNISELGSKIAIEKECDYCCIYTGFNMSLRSINDFDVSAIAKHYGGGGHKNASGMPPQKYYIEKYLES